MYERRARRRFQPTHYPPAGGAVRRLLAALAVLALSGCAGSDPFWEISQWGCGVGSCLPKPDGQHQCQANDLGAHIWLARAPTPEPAAATAENKCAAESEMPNTCVVVLSDCARQLPYCTGPDDRSMRCRLFGPPGSGSGSGEGSGEG